MLPDKKWRPSWVSSWWLRLRVHTTWEPHWLGAAKVAGTFIRVQQFFQRKAISPKPIDISVDIPKMGQCDAPISPWQQRKQHYDPKHGPNDEGRQDRAVLLFGACIRLIHAYHVPPPCEFSFAREAVHNGRQFVCD